MSLLIQEVPVTNVPMELLLLADPSEDKVRSYLPGSKCFVVSDGAVVVGACVVYPRGTDTHELMSIAVDPAHQKSGYGTALLKWVIDFFRNSGARQLEVGTGTFGYQLAFYQRHGFRVTSIDRDFFVKNYPEPIFEDGIQLLDMLRLTLRYSGDVPCQCIQADTFSRRRLVQALGNSKSNEVPVTVTHNIPTIGILMATEQNRVCPVELADSLDSRLRRWFQNPRKILAPFVTEGMTALDVGCGPGFFSIELGQLVGSTGRVIAADLQQGMLDKLADKIKGTELATRIGLIKCDPGSLNVSGPVDFILTFYMVHEVPDQAAFFRQLFLILRETGTVLIVEPKMFHVSRTQFNNTIRNAEAAGFVSTEGPGLPMSWSAILKKAAVRAS